VGQPVTRSCSAGTFGARRAFRGDRPRIQRSPAYEALDLVRRAMR